MAHDVTLQILQSITLTKKIEKFRHKLYFANTYKLGRRAQKSRQEILFTKERYFV